MKPLFLPVAVPCAILIGCATTPVWTTESAKSVQPMRDMHRACMVANVASLDKGSGDPQGMVDTVEALCAPLLEPMRSFIAQEGYGETTADAVVAQVMAENRREAQDVIVRVRTEARKSP